MKHVYKILIWISLLAVIFLNLVSIATSRDQYLASMLLQHEGQWSLVFTEGSRLEERFGREEANVLLSQFLGANAHSEYRGVGTASIAGLITLLFSAIGWWRERGLAGEKSG